MSDEGQIPPQGAPARPEDYLSRLRLPSESGLESTEGVADANEARRRFDRFIQSPAFLRLDARAREIVAAGVRSALEKFQAGPSNALDASELVGMEALVLLNGRPSLPIVNGWIDEANPELSGWDLKTFKTMLKRAISSVGRIDLNGRHIGTGGVIARGVILTNRHVAEAIAKFYRQGGEEKWLLKAGDVSIDFVREQDSNKTSKFRILDVIAAGPDPIEDTVDLAHLDAALLRVETENAAGEPLPSSLSLSQNGNSGPNQPGQVVVIGYPGPPSIQPSEFVAEEEALIRQALERIFSMTYGVKRIAPGQIMQPLGTVPDDAKGWVFTHDVTTLGGNSGSFVIRLNGATPRVIGLHFAGATRKRNLAHAAKALDEPLISGNANVGWLP